MLKKAIQFILLVLIFNSNHLLSQEWFWGKSISSGSYSQLWLDVKKQEKKGLPKSALKIVNQIYAKAKKETNPSQYIKSIIFKAKYLGQVEEKAFVKGIQLIQEESQQADEFSKPILQSMLAEIYWKYYQRNRWYIRKRTATKNFQQNDISTYDARKLIEQVVSYYTKSITNIGTLQQTEIKDYRSILNTKSEHIPTGRKYRSTVYDFLIHRAVDFFMSSEPDIVRPAESFVLNRAEYFSPAREFVKLNIQSKDTLAYKYHALKALQDATKFHLEDKNIDSLMDLEFKRLRFVKSYYTGSEADELYIKALRSLESFAGEHPSVAQVAYLIASYWQQKGNLYKPLRSAEHKQDKVTAWQICAKAIKKHPQSNGGQNCRYLQSMIERKKIRLKVEQINLPDRPFKTYVSYRNVEKLYFKIYRVDKTLMQQVKIGYSQYYKKYKKYIYYQDYLLQQFATKPAMKEFVVNLPNDKDYQQHAVEAKIPALAIGQYLITVGSSKELAAQKNVTGFAFTATSYISYIKRNNKDSSKEFYVLNRLSGEPLQGVKAEVYQQKYNYDTSKYESNKVNEFVTDRNGYFKVKPPQKYRRFYIIFKHAKDFLAPISYYSSSTLRTSTNLYQYRSYKKDKQRTTKVFLFTDRAIYRPGQTIYFKGMLVDSDSEKQNELKTKQPVSVTFYDVNRKKISSLGLVSNEYGTFSGTFIAPQGVLTGNMLIKTDLGGYHSVSVEEYKRPKFEVSFSPVKGTYKLGSVVTVSGKARAYSAANIDHAAVRFRVVRRAKLPYWWYRSYGYYPSSPAVEILSGKAKTDKFGKFTINFKAIPDLSISKEAKPTFTYKVYADITDSNGETRSSTINVRVGYTGLVVAVRSSSLLDLQKGAEWKITTTNLNGTFEPTAGTIEIYKLQSPKRFFRERLWPKPDKFLLSREESYKLFPDDEYSDENNRLKWPKGEKVFAIRFHSQKQKYLKLKDVKSWQQGNYILQIQAKDKAGETVKEVSYF
ncbi:MAG: MG2 domain-containing protein, partial [Spirochaetota bacterium]